MLIKQDDVSQMETRVDQLLEDNSKLHVNINELIEENRRLVEIVEEGKGRQEKIEQHEKNQITLGIEIERLHSIVEERSEELRACEEVER